MVNKQRTKAVLIQDAAIPSDSNSRKKEQEKLEKCYVLREELERLCKVKTTVVRVINGATRGSDPRVAPADSRNN